jgi:RNA polymerase sigma factor (sigma-70 family)
MLTHIDVSPTEMVNPDRRIGENQCGRTLVSPGSFAQPAAWNILQFGHRASQGRQSARAFPFDEGFESFTNQRCFLRDSGELLGNAYQIVIKRNGGSQRILQAPIIASNDVIVCAFLALDRVSITLRNLATLQYPDPLIRLQKQMKGAASLEPMAFEADQRISDVVKREQSRLRNFIRRRVPDPRDAEDILQDVFYELVEANRLLMPIEHVTGWLFRVARNRITDLFRKKKPESFSDAAVAGEDGEVLRIEDLLPSPGAGPEALYFRNVLLDELESAVDELPKEQREVFVAHELEGRSFKEMAAETGVSVNTLLSRKRYAVLHLRERLQSISDEFTKA